MKINKKLSTPTIYGRISPPDEPRDIYEIMGQIRRVRVGEGTYGEFTELQGAFTAINLDTGEEIRAGKCFLPEIAQALVVDAFEDGTVLEFAFRIGIVPSDKAAIGYEYTAEPLLELDTSDPLTMLRDRAHGKLPAPESETAGEDEGTPPENVGQGTASELFEDVDKANEGKEPATPDAKLKAHNEAKAASADGDGDTDTKADAKPKTSGRRKAKATA